MSNTDNQSEPESNQHISQTYSDQSPPTLINHLINSLKLQILINTDSNYIITLTSELNTALNSEAIRLRELINSPDCTNS
jgi:hypothetical protein